MSTALKTAIVSRLTGDAALVALLAVDPADGTSPAIFNASKNQAPPVYNCVTFRENSGNPDNRFRPGVPGQTGTKKVEDFYYDFEAWTDQPDSGPIEAIGDRLDALFHQVAYTTTDSRAFWCERITKQGDLYDEKLNAWYGLFRYRVRVST